MTGLIRPWILEALGAEPLRRLCNKRTLGAGGSKDALRQRLARSYRGDLAALIVDLRRADLVAVLKQEGLVAALVKRAGGLSNIDGASRETLEAVTRVVFTTPMALEAPAPFGADCPVSVRWEDAELDETIDGDDDGNDPVGRPVTLLSVRYSTDRDSRLTADRLRSSLSGSTEVLLASAFYDVRFCETLLLSAELNGLRTARLLFNGLAGIRLDEQRQELEKLARRLGRRIDDVRIRLAFEPGLFHSKLIIGRGADRRVVMIGSANATTAALEQNEEILLEIDSGIAPLVDYFDRVWSEALDLTDAASPVRSLVQFFRTGALYFKPTASLGLTLNPFRDLINALPEGERAKLGG